MAVNTVRAWLSVLEASYLILLLPAWHPNTRKQVVKAPKLHFLDSGLACHLLGIRTAEQLVAHPLRGAVFESWMVSEVAKARLHAGLPLRMFHYREAQGPEVDLLVQGEKGWILAEAKSGSTVDTSFFAGMEAFAARLPADAPIAHRLVYGGGEPQLSHGIAVTPWAQVQEAFWLPLSLAHEAQLARDRPRCAGSVRFRGSAGLPRPVFMRLYSSMCVLDSRTGHGLGSAQPGCDCLRRPW